MRTDPDAHRYSADAGLLSLREALCDRFRSTLGIDSGPDNLILTAGGNQAFWDWLARHGYATIDLLKLIDSNERGKRFARAEEVFRKP